MSFIEMRASEQIRRWISSLFDISSEKNAIGSPASRAAATAMFSANDVLPMPGRAATMMKFPGWNPVVIASMSAKPDVSPVRPPRKW